MEKEDDMTVGGYVFFAIFAIIILIVACIIAYESFDNNKPWLSAIAIIAAMVLIISVFFGMRWYFHSTESGKRAIKTQESNFEGGIKRSVKVYDAIGNLLQEYEGKFDVDFNGDEQRILFDDEKGQRHVIYFKTGTIIVEEVK